MALGAIVGAVTSIGSGIFGASQASGANARAKRAAEAAERKAKKITKNTNEYNLRAFEIGKQNYYNERDYQYETAVKSWEYGKEIQDFQYLQDMRQYAKSLQIRDDQLNFNDLGADLAFANEDAALAGIFRQQMFDRESQIASLKKTLVEGDLNRKVTQSEMDSLLAKDMIGKLTITQALDEYTKEATFKKESAMVDSVKAQGQAELRQAGRSRQRAQAVTTGEYFRNLSQIASALSGRQRQAALQLTELGAQTKAGKEQLGFQMNRINNAMLDAINDTQFNMRVLDADVASAVEQSIRNRQDISLRKYGADLNTIANTMIKPERLPYAPMPEITPERIFIEPMKVRPGQVAQPVQQSTFAPLVQGIAGAAGSLAQIDWKAPGGNTTRNIPTNTFSLPSSTNVSFGQAMNMNLGF